MFYLNFLYGRKNKIILVLGHWKNDMKYVKFANLKKGIIVFFGGGNQTYFEESKKALSVKYESKQW